MFASLRLLIAKLCMVYANSSSCSNCAQFISRYILLNICMHTRIHICIATHTYTYIYICIHIYLPVCVCLYIYSYSYRMLTATLLCINSYGFCFSFFLLLFLLLLRFSIQFFLSRASFKMHIKVLNYKYYFG